MRSEQGDRWVFPGDCDPWVSHSEGDQLGSQIEEEHAQEAYPSLRADVHMDSRRAGSRAELDALPAKGSDMEHPDDPCDRRNSRRLSKDIIVSRV